MEVPQQWDPRVFRPRMTKRWDPRMTKRWDPRMTLNCNRCLMDRTLMHFAGRIQGSFRLNLSRKLAAGRTPNEELKILMGNDKAAVRHRWESVAGTGTDLGAPTRALRTYVHRVAV